MARIISGTGRILLLAFVLFSFFGLILVIAFRQRPAARQKLIFVGFTNITGNSCGVFEFPASYGPPLWKFFGEMSIRPEVRLQGDKGEDFGDVMESSPRTNGILSGSIYSIRVPAGSTTMRVRLDEHVEQAIRLGRQFTYSKKMLQATSDLVRIPISFQEPEDRDLRQWRNAHSNSIPSSVGEVFE